PVSLRGSSLPARCPPSGRTGHHSRRGSAWQARGPSASGWRGSDGSSAVGSSAISPRGGVIQEPGTILTVLPAESPVIATLPATLHVVATPIGHLGDLSPR